MTRCDRDCSRYDVAEESLKTFTRSKVRSKVLLCLKKGSMSTGELENEMRIRNTTILHAIKEMISSDLIAKSEKGYKLTNLGRMEACRIDDSIDFVLIMERYSDFWLTHDLSAIPETLLVRIGMLSESEILEGDPSAILKTQEFFISELKNSTMIQGLSPIIIPGYAEAIASAVINGAEVDLILTEQIINIVIKDYHDVLQQLLRVENFRLYSIEAEVAAAFTITNSLLSLGLFRIDGGYDVGRDLNCLGKNAIAWGKELFNHYLSKSNRIDSI